MSTRKTIGYCVKTGDGRIVREGLIAATREALRQSAESFDQPCCGGPEATICRHWMYPFSQALCNATADESTGEDKSHVPPAHETLRRQLCFRAPIVRSSKLFKNKSAGLLIEEGIRYETSKLHGKQSLYGLRAHSSDLTPELKRLMSLTRDQTETLRRIDRGLVSTLLDHFLLAGRMEYLRTIAGVGEMTALTWVLEIGESTRFPNARHAIGYCGLCAAQKESAGRKPRT